tara:strand:- start:99 stop:428 length:330 start_codon:yes stop_codon:yes gene_type:complete
MRGVKIWRPWPSTVFGNSFTVRPQPSDAGNQGESRVLHSQGAIEDKALLEELVSLMAVGILHFDVGRYGRIGPENMAMDWGFCTSLQEEQMRKSFFVCVTHMFSCEFTI